ncbi:hypothetical protein MLD38_012751 [Melastoma candidum]|uniref:Uncharacterized protein n=1 Tax=Melastoma candidum TaxID=119954 RepID=A0ACB9R7C9_9MYRT|nr:hypothetical protein MLD38_012751 [Melastoma candidum]
MSHQELHSFVQVWDWLSYPLPTPTMPPPSSRAARIVIRLLSLLPVVAVLAFLPLRLTSIHLVAPTAFFFLWLANSKLLLLAFNHGPLANSPNLLNFLVLAALPVKISSGSTYDYRPLLPSATIYALYCLHLYLELEIVLKLCALPAMAMLSYELEPQFDEPYLATSLQEFWGRRWNLMVTKILRSTVYNPIRQALGESKLIGMEAAKAVATLAAFTVSGLMHEALYLYMTRARPTWEVTWFFVVHGFCVMAEVETKRRAGVRWRPRRAVAGGLTVGFLGLTGAWLFFPQLVREGVVDRVVTECRLGLDGVKQVAAFL